MAARLELGTEWSSVLREHADSAAERSVVCFVTERGEEISLTHGGLHARARSIAAHLRDQGATGERALLLHPPGLDYVAALLACFYAGVVAVPAYPPRARRGAERLESLIADARAKFALTTRHALAQQGVDPTLGALTWIATDTLPTRGERFAPPPLDALALLQYTSGSTSTPKGVMLTHRQLSRHVEALIARGEVTNADRLVSWLPPYHDMGLVGCLLLPIALGIDLTLMAPSTFVSRPLRWLELMSSRRASVSGGPNFAYELCVRRLTPAVVQALDLSAWRLAFSGAERVRSETLRAFTEALAPAGLSASALAPCYGLAEATLAVTLGPVGRTPTIEQVDQASLAAGKAEPATLGQRALELVACGRPLDGTSVVIADPERATRKGAREIGEIWVRGEGVASGYWDAPERTREVFHARLQGEGEPPVDYLRTGDLGYLSNGELYVTGRRKELLILRGRNHHPEDIERVAQAAHRALRPDGGAAFSCERDGEEQLVLVHEIEPARASEAQSIIALVRTAVADAFELSLLDVVLVRPGTVPRTSSGKRQRTRTRELYLEGRLTRLGDVLNETMRDEAPQALVVRIASEMAGLLGLESIAPDADFFWLGGHSLLATQLVSRLRETLSVDLDLPTLFAAPSPQKLAARIAALPRAAARPEVGLCDRTARIPLSFSQERMWFLHQLDPTSAAYNVVGAVSIDGPLVPATLRLAFRDLLDRHESLRTRFVSIDGEPHVEIDATPNVEIPFHDLGDGSDAEQRARDATAALAALPFDVAREPLVRAALYRIGRDRHVFALSIHHLVTDAWSEGVLLRDLLSLYHARNEARPLPAPETALSYVDYAAFQRAQTRARPPLADLAYWQKRLAGAEPLLLPTSRPRGRRSALGAHEPFTIDPGLLNALRELGATEGATLFMVLLAAFDVVLHRHSGQRDVVVGVPVAGRNHVACEALVGTLVNTLALRAELAPEQSFRSLLRQVRERAIEAYAHQELPFAQLVSQLGLERRADGSPLVSVMFDYQNVPMNFRAGELALAPLVFSRGATQFDLSLLLHDSALGQSGAIEYSTDLFDAALIRRFVEHYLTVLAAVVRDPDRTVSQLPLLESSERAEILRHAGEVTGRAHDGSTLRARVAAQAAARPDATAVRDRSGLLRYAELERRISALAEHLRSAGAGPGQRVGICLERGKEQVIAMLAVLEIGAAYVPLDPRHPPARLAYVLEDAAPTVVLTDARARGALAACSTITLLDVHAAAVAPTRRAPESTRTIAPSDAAYVIYTSGSTGRPKGVEVSRAALDNFLTSMAHTPGLGPHDRVLSTTTIAFDIAALELLLPPMCGALVYVADADTVADGKQLCQLIDEVAPTLLQATPASFRMLLEAGFAGAPELTVLCGGEALSLELARALSGRARALWNVYGPTETTVWSLLQRIEPGATSVPIGKPLDETRVYVLDRHGALCPLGVAGELHIGGAGVANGYFQRPQLTAERFVSDPHGAPGARMYKTGDLARLRFDGTFEHLGRLDFQLKLRGFRIEPEEIESVLREDERVREALVIAREDRPGDVRLVAYCVADEASAPSASELRARLCHRLPEYMVPSAFVTLRALPKTANEKIDRAALPVPSELDRAHEGEPLAPRDALEAALVALWADVLSIEAPGVRDSFFTLGGHSLLAVRMFARLCREHGVDIPLATLFESPTIEHLARRIREVKSARPAPTAHEALRYVVPLATAGYRAPLFCVHGAGGNVVGLDALARQLGRERPFYGIQARGVDGTSEPFARIEDAAAAYVEELRKVQPHGPYYLSGYCGGGSIAFEMARLLGESGERVALLALIDTYRPGVRIDLQRAARLAEKLRTRGLAFVAARARARLWSNLLTLWTTLRIAGYRALGRAVPHELRDFWLTAAFFRAVASYQPAPLAQHVVVLRASEVDPALARVGRDLGWSEIASEGVESHDVPGDHHTLLVEPHTSVLAEKLAACLADAELRATPDARAASVRS